MENTLEEIANIIHTYDTGEWQSADKLRVLLRNLTAYYYHLTRFNIEAFQKHNAIQYLHKGAVGRGVILAEEQVPELRITRKILFATSKVIDAMRSEIGILRTEQ